MWVRRRATRVLGVTTGEQNCSALLRTAHRKSGAPATLPTLAQIRKITEFCSCHVLCQRLVFEFPPSLACFVPPRAAHANRVFAKVQTYARLTSHYTRLTASILSQSHDTLSFAVALAVACPMPFFRLLVLYVALATADATASAPAWQCHRSSTRMHVISRKMTEVLLAHVLC